MDPSLLAALLGGQGTQQTAQNQIGLSQGTPQQSPQVDPQQQMQQYMAQLFGGGQQPQQGMIGGGGVQQGTPHATATMGGPPQVSLSDPSSVDAYISYMGQQPGVNPSVKNDPNYWKSRIMSGDLGTDSNYYMKKMMTPEGPPVGANKGFAGMGMGMGMGQPGMGQQQSFLPKPQGFNASQFNALGQGGYRSAFPATQAGQPQVQPQQQMNPLGQIPTNINDVLNNLNQQRQQNRPLQQAIQPNQAGPFGVNRNGSI